MREEEFAVRVGDGELVGHRGGDGPPALLLHGGPGLSDYTEGLVAELHQIFDAVRYTQRGTPPTTVGPPYTIEAHMDDALAVLDQFAPDRAWVVGHSWGGHLALHLAVAHPERLLGIICVNTLGASLDVLPQFGEALMRDLSSEERAFAEEVEAEQKRGEGTSERMLEQFQLIWPNYFAEPSKAPPMPEMNAGFECGAATWKSIGAHAGSGTLTDGLPNVSRPALFVHGELDPLPVRTAAEAAQLIPGAELEILRGCGHFPWFEAPGAVREAVKRFLATR